MSRSERQLVNLWPTAEERVGRMVRTIGPDMQMGVAKAVKANQDLLVTSRSDFAPFVGGEEGYYRACQWWIWCVGHGDTDCGNWHTWAALGWERNWPELKALAPDLAGFEPPARLHPELVGILGERTKVWGERHFSALAVPALAKQGEDMRVIWPDLNLAEARSAGSTWDWLQRDWLAQTTEVPVVGERPNFIGLPGGTR